jgi:hypothetical protein
MASPAGDRRDPDVANAITRRAAAQATKGIVRAAVGDVRLGGRKGKGAAELTRPFTRDRKTESPGSGSRSARATSVAGTRGWLVGVR